MLSLLLTLISVLASKLASSFFSYCMTGICTQYCSCSDLLKFILIMLACHSVLHCFQILLNKTKNLQGLMISGPWTSFFKFSGLISFFLFLTLLLPLPTLLVLKNNQHTHSFLGLHPCSFLSIWGSWSASCFL